MRLAASALALSLLANPVTAWADVSHHLTAEKLAQFSPRARADLVAVIIERAPDLTKAGIDTELELQHFLAQCAAETGGYRRLDENMNYSATRILQVFGRRVNADDANRLARNPRALANFVYGGRNGNDRIDDGWRYRGSGFIQLTFKDNYEARGLETNLPLVTEPDIARKPREAFSVAIAYWTARSINGAAAQDDVVKVRRLVNGGTNGLHESKVWLARAKSIFTDKPPPVKESAASELAVIGEILTEQSFMSLPHKEAGLMASVRGALVEFQRVQGIEETGTLNEATLYALTDPDGRFTQD